MLRRRAVSHQRPEDRASARAPPALTRWRRVPFASGALADARRGLADGAAIAARPALLRDLGNLPGNVCTPRYLADAGARSWRARTARVRVRVLDEAQIRRLKMGCLLAVSRGSAEPPRFIVLEYRGGRARRGARGAGGQGRHLRHRRHLAEGSRPPWTR